MKDWQIHMGIWGYHVGGEPDGIAMMAEQPGARTICGKVWWDRDRYGLKDEWIDRGNGWEPVPEFWALPAVTELLLKVGIGIRTE
jgi:hypothetical protein